eukprot:maker-scaffold142_size315517-snap-gene-2.24 protein:Tk07716 transcript:maker-scaffold142_size315517-snap-gene-2.24-mRNA-1 annotation:"heterogeneous nuclear ribonucleoprotein a2 b1 homolog"
MSEENGPSRGGESEGVPPTQSAPEQERKLFLGGLNYGTTEEGLREHFSNFGELTDVVVMRFPDTKRSRGFGFVTFATAEQTESCFQERPHTLDGTEIETKRATPREEKGAGTSGSSRDGRAGGGKRGGGGGGGGRGHSGDRDSGGHEAEALRKLFIGGLDYSTTDEGLQTYFEQFGEIVDSVVMKFRDTKRSRGFGFVTYATMAMVDNCQANRPHMVDGTKIETKRATPREDVGRGEGGQTVKKIFVGGLNEAISDRDIKDYFGDFGSVTHVEQMIEKSTGKKRGFGFVEFDDYDAVDKILLQGRHNLKNRRLDIKRALSKSEMHMSRDAGPGGPGGPPRERFGEGRGPPAPWGSQREDRYKRAGSGSGFARGGEGYESSYAPTDYGSSAHWGGPAASWDHGAQEARGGGAWDPPTRDYGWGNDDYGGGPLRGHQSEMGGPAPRSTPYETPYRRPGGQGVSGSGGGGYVTGGRGGGGARW